MVNTTKFFKAYASNYLIWTCWKMAFADRILSTNRRWVISMMRTRIVSIVTKLSDIRNCRCMSHVWQIYRFSHSWTLITSQKVCEGYAYTAMSNTTASSAKGSVYFGPPRLSRCGQRTFQSTDYLLHVWPNARQPISAALLPKLALRNIY